MARDKLQLTGLLIDDLRALRPHLCRCSHRLRDYATKNPRATASERLGLVFVRGQKFAKKAAKAAGDRKPPVAVDIPSGKQYATRLNISEAAWSKFVNGNADGDKWIELFRDAMELMLIGAFDSNNERNKDERWPIVKEILDYFYGTDWKKRVREDGEDPAYFRGRRKESGAAWSTREAAGEIDAVTDRFAIAEHSKNCRIVVSGEGRLLLEDRNVRADEPKEGRVRDAMIRAINAGVPTLFVYPKGSDAEKSVRDLLDDCHPKGGPKNVRITCCDPMSRTAPDRWWDFLSPVHECWLLDTGNQDKDEEEVDRALFLVRSRRAKDEDEKHSLTIDLNEDEMKVFVDEWLAKIDPAADAASKVFSSTPEAAKPSEKRGEGEGEKKRVRKGA
jgi:hypothetical protein